MAISKLILNGVTQMDVTSDTVSAGKLLSGETATKNDGTKVTGTIVAKSAADLIVSGRNITTPAGYYSASATQSIANASISKVWEFSSSTGYFRAGYTTESPGYVLGNGITTGTLNTQSAQTITPTAMNQYIGSYQWLTGSQTIKGDANLASSNIVSGVSIFGVTGTYSPATSSLTVTPTENEQTFNATGVYGYKPVTVNGISSTYVGTGIARMSSANMSATAYLVTAPSGYYSRDGNYMFSNEAHADPVISFSSATGLISVKHTQTENVVVTGTNQTYSSYQLPICASDTITPGTSNYYIGSRAWLIGSITIKGDANLVPSNIASGVSIFGVNGTHEVPAPSSLTVTPTENEQTFNATGVYGYKPVTVNAISSTYVGTGVPARSSYHLTVSEATITAPAGYYSTAAAKSIANVNGSPLFTFSSETGMYTYGYSAISGGYISGTISASNRLPYLGARTITPRSTSQYIYSYQWLTGSQTIAGDANLVPANIVSGVSIFGVNGNLDAKYYNIYKAILTTHSFISSGSTTYKYTSEDVSDFCDSFSSIREETFVAVDFLSDFTFNNVTTINRYAFANCGALGVNAPASQHFHFPKVTTISWAAFFNNYSLSTIEANNCVSIGAEAFAYCTALTCASFPSCTTLSGGAFSYCTRLVSAYFPLCESMAYSTFYMCSSLTTVSFPICKNVGNDAFRSCRALTTISFPSCTYIESSAFVSCSNLTTAYFPLCETIGSSAFCSCSSLTTISFPVCTNISPAAFAYCRQLVSAIFPSCSAIGSYAFQNCSSLTTIDFPLCETIGYSAFYSCIGLTTISFPSCTNIDTFAFFRCNYLSTVSFPLCKSIGSSAFQNCSSLTTISFPSCEVIHSWAFQNCWRLIELHLESVSSVPVLSDYRVFSSTPIGGYSATAGRYGSIFVPMSLYDLFITATNWSSFSSRIVSV